MHIYWLSLTIGMPLGIPISRFSQQAGLQPSRGGDFAGVQAEGPLLVQGDDVLLVQEGLRANRLFDNSFSPVRKGCSS